MLTVTPRVAPRWLVSRWSCEWCQPGQWPQGDSWVWMVGQLLKLWVVSARAVTSRWQLSVNGWSAVEAVSGVSQGSDLKVTAECEWLVSCWSCEWCQPGQWPQGDSWVWMVGQLLKLWVVTARTVTSRWQLSVNGRSAVSGVSQGSDLKVTAECEWLVSCWSCEWCHLKVTAECEWLVSCWSCEWWQPGQWPQGDSWVNGRSAVEAVSGDSQDSDLKVTAEWMVGQLLKLWVVTARTVTSRWRSAVEAVSGVNQDSDLKVTAVCEVSELVFYFLTDSRVTSSWLLCCWVSCFCYALPASIVTSEWYCMQLVGQLAFYAISAGTITSRGLVCVLRSSSSAFPALSLGFTIFWWPFLFVCFFVVVFLIQP